MFVENQPRTPSMRALSAGATTVFINVWPVLKSFPAMGTLLRFASSHTAGKSSARLGAPFANGTPSFKHAHAYSCELEMVGSSWCSAFSNVSTVWWTPFADTYTSVDPHHTATARLQLLSAMKRRISSRNCSTISALLPPFLMCVPFRRLTYSG